MKKVSLCMIVGNVEEYITRCLENFLPLADELCLVRAIGNQAPDGTLERAKAVCVQFDIPLNFAEYHNAPANRDWPHIDNFGAARQKSFDLATGEYCFWVDTDDVLDQAPTAGKTPYEIVRELAERGGHVAFVMPYRIFGKGVNVPRERMLLRGSGTWKYAVHEHYDFKVQPARAIEENRVVVTHLPHASKTGSSERNLRILKNIPESEMSAGLLYHLHGELAVSGDTMGAIKTAERALKHPDLGKAERFELFLGLAQLSTHDQAKEAMLQGAYVADPRRREALGLLAMHSLDYGRYENALAYARQMMATLRPINPDWNHREATYGWLGDEIYSQALRGNDMFAEAEMVRREILRKAGGAKIALLHATRGRPQQAALARKMWLDLAENPAAVEHIFVMDADDQDSIALRRMHHRVIAPGGGCVAAWNAGAAATEAPVLVQLSDDWTPPAQWDKLILGRLGDISEPKVLAVSDGVRGDGLLCMAICTRSYLRQDGFFFHPDFTGVYSDNWFTDQAYTRKQVVEARDLVFTHDHPIKTGKPMDETYARQNAPERYQHGREIYDRLAAGKDWSSIPGFYDYWLFYKLVADRLQDGDTIAEVGVFCGRSLIHLAMMLKAQGKNVHIYAVDNFQGNSNPKEAAAAADAGDLRETFRQNCKRCEVDGMITVLDGDSREAAVFVQDHSLAFCYIDANHEYDAVRRDLDAWERKVRPGGIFAGHDAQNEDVAEALKEHFTHVTNATYEAFGSVWIRGGKEAL